MFNTKNFMLMGLLCLSAGAFAQNGKDKPKTPNVSLNLKKYIDPANMDPSAKPGDDFFEYANGAWVKNNPIPAKETRWGSFGILHQENTDRLKSILTDVSKTPGQPKGSLKQRVGDLYASGIDSVAIEKRGYDPINPDLERVSKINNLDGVVNEAIYERTHGIGSPLFGFGVGQDSKHPTVNILNFGQGGTSLPDRDNYLKNDERTKKIQAAYKNYIVTLFKLTGTSDADAAKNAETIFNIETAFAKAQLSRVAMRDPNKTYNKFAVKDFQSLTPHLKWDELLPLMEVKGQDTILVSNPAFYKATDALLASTPVDDWKTYLTWNVLKGSASSLSSPFEKASFAFSSAE